MYLLTLYFQETSLLLLLLCGGVLSLNQCCPPGQIVRRGGYCGTSLFRISLNCSFGHMLLKHVIVSGTKLSTEDSPDLVTAEDPSQ